MSSGGGSAAVSEHHLIGILDVGPVHLACQDISGAAVFRLAATHPDDVVSFTATEMGLAGFGLESFADPDVHPPRRHGVTSEGVAWLRWLRPH